MSDRTLADWAREGLTAEARRSVIAALAAAVAALHSAGRVHRALSPESIGLLRGSEGFAITLNPASTGASAWRSPETIEGEATPRPTDDVWSLGLIAFWLLTGRSYWLHDRGEEWSSALREEILRGRLVPASERAAAVAPGVTLPAGFDGWFVRCVAAEATARFRDAGRAADAIPWRLPTAAASVIPPDATSTVVSGPFGPRGEAPARRSRASRVAGAIAALGAVSVLVGTRWTLRRGEAPQVVAAVAIPARAVELAAGGGHTCAVLSDGTLSCWGANDRGQLGAPHAATNTPGRVPHIAHARAVATGEDLTCVLVEGGAVSCFGREVSGAVGVSDAGALLPPVAELALGVFHGCARLLDGTVRCWGANAHGQLGDGTALPRAVPVSPQDQAEVTALAAGGSDTCAARADGTVHCWGTSYGSGPGAGPQEVAGLRGIVRVAVGQGDACAVDRVGAIRCWSAIRC